MSETELVTYHGNCHCGAVKFTVTQPKITETSGGTCDCSICTKKGYVWAFPPEGALKFERGEEKLVSYEFGPKTLAHKFCPTCGTGVMGFRHGAPPGMGIAVNARTFNDFDIRSIKVPLFNGCKTGDPYALPKFTGKTPEVPGDDLQLYNGSCHCGAVTFAIKSAPIDTLEVMDDNCSICTKNASLYVYPLRSHISISGIENTSTYEFNNKSATHHFCTTCGIPVYLDCHDPAPEVLASGKLSEGKLKKIEMYKAIVPVNVRCLDLAVTKGLRGLKYHISNDGLVGYVVG